MQCKIQDPQRRSVIIHREKLNLKRLTEPASQDLESLSCHPNPRHFHVPLCLPGPLPAPSFTCPDAEESQPSRKCIPLPGTHAGSMKLGCEEFTVIRGLETLHPLDNNGADAMFGWERGQAPRSGTTSSKHLNTSHPLLANIPKWERKKLCFCDTVSPDRSHPEVSRLDMHCQW